MNLVIATILTAYIATFTVSNQAFAQPRLVTPTTLMYGKLGQTASNSGHVGHSGLLGGMGFGVAAITKFKAHKDNPTQITSGIGLGVGVLHKFTP